MTEHLDDYGNPIHPPPPGPAGDPTVEPPLSADLQNIADLLWESAQGAPPIDQDPTALHFRDHCEDRVPECRLCEVSR